MSFKQKASYTKLISKILNSNPDLNEDEIIKRINHIRSARNGSLTGISTQEIISKIVNFKVERKPLGIITLTNASDDEEEDDVLEVVPTQSFKAVKKDDVVNDSDDENRLVIAKVETVEEAVKAPDGCGDLVISQVESIVEDDVQEKSFEVPTNDSSEKNEVEVNSSSLFNDLDLDLDSDQSLENLNTDFNPDTFDNSLDDNLTDGSSLHITKPTKDTETTCSVIFPPLKKLHGTPIDPNASTSALSLPGNLNVSLLNISVDC